MSDDQPKIETLGGFVNRVSQIREEWGIDKHKELWFRGEGEKHENPFFAQLFIVPKRSPTR